MGRKQDTNKTHRSEQTPREDSGRRSGVLARSLATLAANRFRRLDAYQRFAIGEEFSGLFLGDKGVPDVPADLEVCAMISDLRRSAPKH